MKLSGDEEGKAAREETVAFGHDSATATVLPPLLDAGGHYFLFQSMVPFFFKEEKNIYFFKLKRKRMKPFSISS